MISIPKIFHDNTSQHFQDKLFKLFCLYEGVKLGTHDSKHTLCDELQFALELHILTISSKKNELIGVEAQLANIEKEILKNMENSKYSYLSVVADGKHWNPKQQSIKEFKISNIEASSVKINSGTEKTVSVKDVFLSI